MTSLELRNGLGGQLFYQVPIRRATAACVTPELLNDKENVKVELWAFRQAYRCNRDDVVTVAGQIDPQIVFQLAVRAVDVIDSLPVGAVSTGNLPQRITRLHGTDR